MSEEPSVAVGLTLREGSPFVHLITSHRGLLLDINEAFDVAADLFWAISHIRDRLQAGTVLATTEFDPVKD